MTISSNIQRLLDGINSEFDKLEKPHKEMLAELEEQRKAHLNNLAIEIQSGRIK